LSRGPVQVDREACGRLASLLADRRIPPDAEERRPEVPADLIGNYFLALVAICHQTSPLKGRPLEGEIDGRILRGWDYLSARFEMAARHNPSILEPADWADFTAGRIRKTFRDERYGDRLTDPDGRAALLRDLGAHMLAWGWRRADALYHHCEARVATGSPNLLETLGRTVAYRDPVHKKALFFLALMRNTHTWHYADEDALGPPVDYHEVRGHLRLGTVRVADPKLERKLRGKSEVGADEDVALRRGVYDAIMQLSRDSGIGPSRLHYLFWNVFRTVCRRRRPQCLRVGPRSKLPQRYVPLTAHEGGEARCPFFSVCASADSPDRYLEHVFATDLY
jgi:hypothetical protein